MQRYQLNENKLPYRLFVKFSQKIVNDINQIYSYNINNDEAISQWSDYLEWIKDYLSNPSIAWDYANRYTRFPNGAIYLSDFHCNVGYAIQYTRNTQQPYVYIFMANLKPEEYGLKVPPTLNENKQPTNRIVYHLKEYQLRRIIRESIKKVLNII